MILLGYIFTVLNYFSYCISRFAKTKLTMLYMDLLSKIFMVIALYCFRSIGGSLSFVVSFILLIIATVKERRTKYWPTGYALFQFMYLAIMAATFDGVASILIFITMSIKLYALWWMRPQGMRMLGIVASLFFIAYQLTIHNWAGLLEICVMASNATSFIKYRNKKI